MSFFRNILNAVSENLISGDAYYLIIKGVLVTFGITVIAWLIAFILGSLISYVMSYEKKVVSAIGRVFSFIFRSSPALLTVLLFYHVFFKSSHIGGMVILGLALGFYGAGHFSEILSRAVKIEQRRLTQGTRDKLEKVYFSMVLPQAMEDSVFQIKRLAIQLLQWTTVAGYISVNDLTQVMNGIGQRTMYPFFSIFFAILCYMIATIVIELIFRAIMKRIK